MTEYNKKSLTPFLENGSRELTPADRLVITATEVLKNCSHDAVEVLLIGMQCLEQTGQMKRKRIDRQKIFAVLDLGVEELKKETFSTSFSRAAKLNIEHKRELGRCKKTVADTRQALNKLMECNPELANKSMRSLTTAQCEGYLKKAFGHSKAMYKKGRSAFSALFSYAIKQGWASSNPITRISVPRIVEKRKPILSLKEMLRLLRTAGWPEHERCQAAAYIMAYAGVRPGEMERLEWEDIHLDEKEIHIAPRHSKTGGGRVIPMAEPLYKILAKLKTAGASGKICCKNWRRRWKALREAAGFAHWTADILRHSYASYHAKYFENYASLQLSMGHRDAYLLKTRYVDTAAVSRVEARAFWGGKCAA